MSIRKVSELPGISQDSAEWDLSCFAKSLLEVSYPDKDPNGDILNKFKSMYMRGSELADAVLSAEYTKLLNMIEQYSTNTTLRIWK